MRRIHDVFVLTLLALAAGLGAVPLAWQHATGALSLGNWLSGLTVGLVCGVLTYSSGRRQSASRTACVVSAVFTAATFPLAAESANHGFRADAACAACAVGLLLWPYSRRFAGVGAMLWGALCGGLDWTSVAVVGGFNSRRAWVAGAAMAGTVAALLAGSSPATSLRLHEAAFILHRDVWLLTPALVLGWYGLGLVRDHRFSAAAVGGLLGLLLAAVGLPVQPRICVLGLACLMPSGAHHLACGMNNGPVFSRLLSFALIACLLVLGTMNLRRWLDGPLLLLALLA